MAQCPSAPASLILITAMRGVHTPAGVDGAGSEPELLHRGLHFVGDFLAVAAGTPEVVDLLLDGWIERVPPVLPLAEPVGPVAGDGVAGNVPAELVAQVRSDRADGPAPCPSSA